MTYLFTACFTYFFLRCEKLSSRVVWTGLKRGGGGGVWQSSEHSSLVYNNNNNFICPRLKIISQSELHKKKSTYLTDLEL